MSLEIETEIVSPALAPEAPATGSAHAKKPQWQFSRKQIRQIFGAAIAATIAVSGAGWYGYRQYENAEFDAYNEKRIVKFRRDTEYFGSSLQQPLAMYTRREEPKTEDGVRRFIFTQAWTVPRHHRIGKIDKTPLVHQFTVTFRRSKHVDIDYRFISKNPVSERPYLNPQVADYLRSCIVKNVR